jgi:hypothetical protein
VGVLKKIYLLKIAAFPFIEARIIKKAMAIGGDISCFQVKAWDIPKKFNSKSLDKRRNILYV